MINTEINYTRVFGIIILIGALIYFSPLQEYITPKPIIKYVNVTQNITHYVTVLVTPTPDGKLFFAGEYQNGTRKLTQPFSWIRKDVSGQKDMKVTTRVYNYMMFDKLHWFNPAEYKYFVQFPDNPNYKFLFIFVNTYMDDVIGDDTRLWLPNKYRYGIEINHKMYYAKDYPEQVRYKELEYTSTLDESTYIQAYGQIRVYRKSSEYRKTAGETSVIHNYLRGGLSNAEDGYILFEIPKDTIPEQIIIRGEFFSFGNSAWIIQNV